MKSVLVLLQTIWYENIGLDRVLFLYYAVSWQVRRQLGITFVTKLANGAAVKVHPVTTFSGIFYSRWQERKDILFIRAHADLARTFIDVGANTGVLSAQLYDKFSTFYLFEPSPSSYSALLETCALNPGVDCRPFNVAIADYNGEVQFLDEGRYSTVSRIVPDSYDQTANLRRVPIVSLDEALRNVTEDMILKIDVEGAEERVFCGAESLFKAEKFRLVMFERLGRTNLDKVREFLDRHRYIIFYVTEDGLASRDERLVQKPLINLFACPATVWKANRFDK
jgi:FkbM family methyltransferase